MRVIDADALKYELFADNYNAKMTSQEVADCIDNSPTIDAVPVARGEWLPAKDPYDRVYCYRHAGCGCEHNEQSAYCPACGAKMESEGSI